MKTEFKEKEDNTSQIEMKICTKCGEEKPATLEFFNKRKGGITGVCKICRNARIREIYSNNPKKFRERTERWKNKNPEKLKAIKKKWSSVNAKRVKETKAKWRKENAERVKEVNAKWRKENPERLKEKGQRYRDNLYDGYVKYVISKKFDIPQKEISRELTEAKRRELKYYRELKQLKKQVV